MSRFVIIKIRQESRIIRRGVEQDLGHSRESSQPDSSRNVTVCDLSVSPSAGLCLGRPQRVLIPHDVPAELTGDQNVLVTIAIHIDRSDVVRALVVIKYMGREHPASIVLKPGGDLTLVGTSRGVDVAVLIEVRQSEAVGAGQIGVDGVDFPADKAKWPAYPVNAVIDTISITEGKITLNSVTMPSKVTADRIFFKMTKTKSPGVTYSVEGYRRTRWAEDEAVLDFK